MFESRFWRRDCQTLSTGLSSGARDGRKIGVIGGQVELAGGMLSGAVEQQPRMSARGEVARDFIEVKLHHVGVGIGKRQGRSDAPRAGQIAPNR